MSHSKSTASAQANLYNRFFEYARVVTSVIVTEEGVYQKGQLPPTYDGSQLELDVVWAVIMISAKAELQVWELAIDYPMDSDKKKGGPLVRDGVQIRAAVGASTVPVLQQLVINTNLDDARKDLGKATFAKFKSDLAAQPTQPKS